MKATLGRQFRVNTGNYGHAQTFVSVSYEPADLGFTHEEWIEHIKEVGTAAAAEELHAALVIEFERQFQLEVDAISDLAN